ncbi:MAG: GNAT family N-acetyltransferase [Proteobacteria bacterium]|nr:GNAT family N-acetyltransferase [Pseudomonadota bacterium]
MAQSNDLEIRPAQPADIPLVLALIHGLAEYEKLGHEVVATEEKLRQSLFGDRPSAEALIARYKGSPAGFALYFHNFSTFLGQPGLYLEDLFVKPEFRGHGIGQAILVHLAALALERGCGRFEWAVLDWNRPARDFYESLGAKPMTDWIIHRVSGEALIRLAQGG